MELLNLPMTPEAAKAINDAFAICREMDSEFLMPEHLLLGMLREPRFAGVITAAGSDPDSMKTELENWIKSCEAPIDDELAESQTEGGVQISYQTEEIFDDLSISLGTSSASRVGLSHIVKSMIDLTESEAAYQLVMAADFNPGMLLRMLIDEFGDGNGEPAMANAGDTPAGNEETRAASGSDGWRKMVVCVNDMLDSHNPLIGREAELERTIRVLCRKEKNNPLHVGEPGVGKTALVYGLARMIEDGHVPPRLLGSRIYRLDVGNLVAGTQFRGDFEKKLKEIMDGAGKENGAIIYIDEIHNLVGAGATGEGSLDASNMLKPYLESGRIRFIGSTTYEEYNRYFAKSKSLVRRFQQIDILEPSVEETVNILRQLRGGYESHHGVRYTDEAITFAVEASARHIADRFLPDKAIDLIDEAGSYREIHPSEKGEQIVDKELVAEILSKVCKVDLLSLREDDSLDTLGERISAQVYGQDEAVRQVTEAIQMSKAGLNDEDKPLASLLFVGPTGVGKTEVARVLAAESGVELLRFDMSEYAEKHAVAKLIGSPAGYVGYEDGGQLTDAVRRAPNCVLLLDEIEKAHSDIYNILLQVMDYGRLTDNKGRHADFRNVTLIMTSNAGAQYASRANVGFASRVTAGDAMLDEVKRTFKPEFINRLTGTVVFNAMDRTMASMILDKKLRQLGMKLKAKNVEITLTGEAREHMLEKGFTAEYGARELDRVIASELKPILMRAILFGPLKNGGGKATIALSDGHLNLTCDDIQA